ncbi:exopolysaccharide transport family protein [Terrihabitans rhizophilus]|uniref:Exopolysaccharide transport family protein n=1 Tax=Terrihabitans rhizophilus TaxID=3092662 RepID=A0ABU4RSB8_9HYPH|nr:exopolysaccharide transport family protein [Terrihabitans sp. PJ23]MDX6807088.1 exopolysaccharide transport family protein [Terrihabitans sp. PJ23]
MQGAVYDMGIVRDTRSPAEIDLGGIGRALWRRKLLILGPTILVAIGATLFARTLVPQYRSEALVLVESKENAYTRPAGAERDPQTAAADELAVQSQVQLLRSRDLALSVVEELDLKNVPEFGGSSEMSSVKAVLVKLGFAPDPALMTDEERALQAYYDHLTVAAIPGSRVISTVVLSADAGLAAQIANTVTTRYLQMQQAAKQAINQQASNWLSGQIADLSRRVAEAEAKVENYRTSQNLFAGPNNSTLSSQQLNELSSELSRAVAQQTEAQTKADAIKQALAAGRRVEFLDIGNSELIRRLAEQRGNLAASIARESRTFLAGHPRMKELNAQLSSVDTQIREEARKVARAYENEATLAASRVTNIRATLDSQKEVAGSANEQEVQLRALEREARAQRELLEQFMTRYRDASAREQVESIPPDSRIISRAAAASSPFSPKPLPIVALSSVAAFILLVVLFTVLEFLSQGSRPVPLAAAKAGVLPARQEIDADTPMKQAAAAAGTTALLGSRDMAMEAADMKILGELATHLAATPRGQDALNILTVTAAPDIDAGGIAMTLARSLAGHGRKAIVVDAGGESARFREAMGDKAETAGLGELVSGEASFVDAIQRDRASHAHMITLGQQDPLEPASAQRIGVVFDALGLTYDFVIVLGPSIGRRTGFEALARRTGAAILIAAAADDEATTSAHQMLLQAGVSDVVVLVAGGTGKGPVSRTTES